MTGFSFVRIDHVQLAMPRGAEADAARYFSGVLGLTQLPKPEPLASRGGCWFEGGGVVLHLGVEEDFVPAAKAHPALVVDDLDALAETLADARYPIRWDRELPGVRRLHSDDCFGNRIEFIQA